MSFRIRFWHAMTALVVVTPILAGLAGCGLLAKSAAAPENNASATETPRGGESARVTQPRQPWQTPHAAETDLRARAPVVPASVEKAVHEQESDLSSKAARLPNLPRPNAADGLPGSNKSAVRRKVVKVGTAGFDKLVLESDGPVLVDFYADWCGPCKRLAPVLDQLAAETPGVRVVKVNIDDSKKLAKRYQVRSVPTVMVFKDGELVSRQKGFANKRALQNLLSR